MTEEELRTKVDDIIASASDYEVAHGMEDQLHIAVIEAFCPEWVKAEIRRLSDADFARYCA